jgi:nitrogenase molybdenum-iron protein beta chain
LGLLYGCALHGAIDTLLAVPDVIPIAHSTAGCSYYRAKRRGAGAAIPATNTQERHIIFGGASRLREELRNAAQIVNGQLYAVVSGCSAEIVGDDMDAMVREFTGSGKDAVYISAPGIRGDASAGYEIAVKSLLGETWEEPRRDGKLVNVWGIIPWTHCGWLAELYALSDYFAKIGYRVNTLFGPEASLDNWRRVSSAAINLALTRHGLPAARYVAERVGGEAVSPGLFPLGAQGEFALASILGADTAAAEASRRKLDWQFAQSARFYYERVAQRTFSVVSDAARALAKAVFLTEELGLAPQSVVITDASEGEALPELAEFAAEHGARRGRPVRLLFSDTESEIACFLAEHGGEITVSDVETSAPVLTQSSFGAAGAERLMEEVFAQAAALPSNLLVRRDEN